MRLAIIGSRSFNDYERLKSVIFDLFRHECFRFNSIVSGGASGADSLGAKFAKENGVSLKEYLPEWDKYGKSAAFKRNRTIIENSDCVLCFWNGISRGTEDSIRIARELKKMTVIVYF